ncbi:MAG: YebC/PmpR family DNA-binding transcriptional regulator [Chloroflexi bacterium]|nr:YebC/PmpR family DNA-binding transcriptional regulator [Chloroflexota bacterium]
MSGHSKWSQIKRQKGVADVRRGAIFTKVAREISLAARQGGGDPNANFRLRLALQKAKENNMPSENVDRAIKRGVGGTEVAHLLEYSLEGYGSNGVAMLVDIVTDNKQRTLQEVRNVFTRHGGNLGEAGSVAWLFENKGIITVEAGDKDADDVSLAAIDAGAEDVKTLEGSVEIYTAPEDMEKVRRALEEKKYKVTSAEVSLWPKSTIELDEKGAISNLKLMEKLEELDDVQKVHSNLEFSEELAEKLVAKV